MAKPHLDRELIVESGTTFGDTAGRYSCPVNTCPERFESVGDKKRHLRRSHRGGGAA